MKPMIKILAMACALAAAAPAQGKLVILHTNDTHSQIDPASDGMGGVARRKVVVDSVRAAEPNVILVDAGDMVQGSLFFNLYRGEVEEKLANALGYEVRILGNHEFDNGMESLAANLATADAALLAANYDTRKTPLADKFIPWVYEEVDGKKIAFMPVNIDPDGIISARNTVGLGYVDAFEAANNTAWYLKNIENMDYVVAITHIGNGPDKQLAASSTNIDVIIGGHSHTLVDPSVPGTTYLVKNANGKDVIVAQCGKSGKYIGQIDLELDGKAPQYKLIPIDSRLDDRLDPAIEEILQPYRAAIDSLNNNYIAVSAVALPKDSSEALNFISDFVYDRGKQLAGNVDLSIVNKGGIRNDLPKGKISEGQFTSTFPFFNKVEVIEISGQQLIEAFNTMAAAGGNGVSANVDAVYDPTTKECVEATIDGKPIDPAKTYVVATIDYLAEGGDYFHSLVDHKLVAESPKLLFEDIVDHFTIGKGKGKKINPSTKARMRKITN